MKIENNIIKENLKNVYFVCGNACAGKTTMARMLAEKYNFHLYDMDKSELFMLERTKDLSKEQMLYQIEKHFRLI